MNELSHDGISLRDIMVPLPSVALDNSCHEAAELFRKREDAVGFAVLDQGMPVGIISRSELTIRLATQFGYAVYSKRPVSELMDSAPLLVDVSEDIDAVERKIASEYASALISGFIVVENTRYLGVGTALALLRKSVERTKLRNGQLKRATLLAKQASMVKTNFLANMSHELRTPLNAVIGFSEIMVTNALGALEPSQYQEYAADILESGRHLLSLINDILDMSKIEAGRYDLQQQSVDMTRLMQSAVKMCSALSSQKKISIGFELQAPGAIIEGAERAIKQMILNLLSNALKYTLVDGTVTIKTSWSEFSEYQLEIIDTGMGIAEDEIDKIQEPFAQATDKRNNKTEGTGLGLPIVKALASLHDASFVLKSELNVGTSVSLIFPKSRVQSMCSAA